MNTLSGLNTGVIATAIMQMNACNTITTMDMNMSQTYQAQALQGYALHNYTAQKMAEIGWNCSMAQTAMRFTDTGQVEMRFCSPADEPKEFWDRLDFATFPENPVREWEKEELEKIEKAYREKLKAIEFAVRNGYGQRNL